MSYDLTQSIFWYGKADIIPVKEKLPSLLIKLSSSSITVGNRQTDTKFGLPFLKFASLIFDSGLAAYPGYDVYILQELNVILIPD